MLITDTERTSSVLTRKRSTICAGQLVTSTATVWLNPRKKKYQPEIAFFEMSYFSDSLDPRGHAKQYHVELATGYYGYFPVLHSQCFRGLKHSVDTCRLV